MIERLAGAARRDVSRETFEKLEAYAALLREENSRQNLVSASTLDALWDRHAREGDPHRDPAHRPR